MKVFDKYIFKKFLTIFVYMVLGFVIIAVIFDISENVDRLITSGAPFKAIVIDYYLMFCLFLANMLSSILISLTIILFTSKLAQNSEIIAIISGGVSLKRLMRPYFYASSILVVLSLFIGHWLLPFANQRKYDFEEQYTRGDFRIADRNLHREIAPGTIVYFQSITPSRGVGYKFALENWNGDVLEKKIIAAKAEFNPDSTLTLIQGHERIFHADGTETIKEFSKRDTLLDIQMSNFGQRDEVVWNMNYRQLADYIEEEKARGSTKISHLELEMHQRTTNAFAIYVLAFIGVSISARKVRGGMGVHLLLGVVVAVLFIFVNRIFAVAATNAGMSSVIAVWMPNLVFTLLGLWIYKTAPK